MDEHKIPPPRKVIYLDRDTVAFLQEAKRALDEQLASRVTVEVTFTDADEARYVAGVLHAEADRIGDATAEKAWLADSVDAIAEEIEEAIQ